MSGTGKRAGRWMGGHAVVGARRCSGLLALCCVWLPAWGWDVAEIGRRAEVLYGPQAEGSQRLEAWWRLLAEQRDRDVEEQLRAVNGFFNDTLRFDDDRRIWQRIDYWATPVESLYQGAADCEDYALAKYVSLRQLGVPMERLRLTYVKASGQAHMVRSIRVAPGRPRRREGAIAAMRTYSCLKPVALITFAHVSNSARWTRLSSSDEVLAGSKPSVRIRSLTCMDRAAARMAFSSRWSLSGGVRAGA